jgi:hypothetical protein
MASVESPEPPVQQRRQPDDLIPCEICDASVSFEDYAAHLRVCAVRRHLQEVVQNQVLVVVPQNPPEGDEDEDEEEDDEPPGLVGDDDGEAEQQQRQLPIIPASTGPTVDDMLLRFLGGRFVGGGRDPRTGRRNGFVLLMPAANGIMPRSAAAGLQDGASYEDNLALQAWMGDVHVGVRDVDAALTRVADVSSEDDECPICRVGITDRVRTRCNHDFCDGCIRTWFERSKRCPVCNFDVEDDVYRTARETQQSVSASGSATDFSEVRGADDEDETVDVEDL